ncbi:MAG: efflux RND transporter permease subunit [Candidatus Loosdrechtia sp.]|uniref:efflux RND transporter permease subunit n=1 Tax=Candidatus Loosdrechtia sp. TaxID=3101272 RepID=UPI003A6B86C3|nr:MAG: MMPL family transporter [Candidatus Jettenia sp. AMX2]
MKNYIRILFKYKIIIIICIAIMTVFFGYYSTGMKTDNSIEIWFSKQDDDLNYYRDFLKKFGDEEFLVVALSSANLFTKERIRQINTLAENLKKIEGVVNVVSLADVFKHKMASPLFQEVIRYRKDQPVMAVFKRQTLRDTVYQNTIISKNGRTTAIIATVKCTGPEARKQLVSEVRNVLKDIVAAEMDTMKKRSWYRLAGPSVVNAELDRMSKRDMARLTPYMFIISIMVLGCLFRKISGVLIPITMVGVCVVWITGCFVLSGQTMNMVSNMLIPLTFIISLSTSIHFMNHYYRECNFSLNIEDAICRTVRHIGVPVLMAALTTMIGFISLTASNIPPVFITGLFMGGCAALTFIVGMVLLPILLSFVPFRIPVYPGEAFQKKGEYFVLFKKNNFKRRWGKEQDFGGFLSWLSSFVIKYKNIILICGFIAGGVSVWGILKIKIESDIMASFPKHSRIVKDNHYIESNLTGLLPIEIVAETTNGTSVFQTDTLNSITTLQRYLHGISEVTTSLSVANYILNIHQNIKGDKKPHSSLPVTGKEAADYLRLVSFYGDKNVDCLYTKDLTNARISVRMKQVGSNRYKTIIESIKEYIQKHLNTAVLSWRITGIVPLLINVQENILWSEIWSFSIAFLLTFLSIAIALKSVKIGLISIIPNLLPITITLGLMGFNGMRLDAATIMIASITLGISVDNTIHIFYRFKRELSDDGDYSGAIHRTLQGVGKTALFTSLSAACGFAVFSLSGFKPVQYFGLLTSITLLNAIISDLLISPSCLMLFKPKF